MHTGSQNQKEGGNSQEASGQQRGRILSANMSTPKTDKAILGIGVKFALNPVTGMGSMAIPVATEPGRSG